MNLKQQIYDLISILDSLMMEDFNYFPSVINSIQTSILHIFNSSSTQTIINILKEGDIIYRIIYWVNSWVNFDSFFVDENILKKLFGALFKIFTLTSNNLENEQDTDSTNFCESSHVNKILLYLTIFKLTAKTVLNLRYFYWILTYFITTTSMCFISIKCR